MDYLVSLRDRRVNGELRTAVLCCFSRRKQGRKIEEDEAWLFMIQMMFALSYLHAKKILHRDVKSQNIFLSHGKCQLGDFGLAKKLEESFELARTPIGTPFYM
jgi:NIMA (never in mitosis gene a)-related kinase